MSTTMNTTASAVTVEEAVLFVVIAATGETFRRYYRPSEAADMVRAGWGERAIAVRYVGR